MSYNSRPLPSHLRGPSLAGKPPPTAAQSPVLLARIAEKRKELDDLLELRDLSAGLAGQMSVLKEKLGTLSDGTEAVAMVVSNWHNVLRAISMASTKIPVPRESEYVPIPETDVPLPQTLVRIPTAHATIVQQHTEAVAQQDESEA